MREFKLYFEMPNQQGDTIRFVFRTMSDINGENGFVELGSGSRKQLEGIA